MVESLDSILKVLMTDPVFCHGCRRWIRNIQASIGRYTRQVLKGAEICHLSCVGITVVGLTLCDTLSGKKLVPNLLF